MYPRHPPDPRYENGGRHSNTFQDMPGRSYTDFLRHQDVLGGPPVAGRMGFPLGVTPGAPFAGPPAPMVQDRAFSWRSSLEDRIPPGRVPPPRFENSIGRSVPVSTWRPSSPRGRELPPQGWRSAEQKTINREPPGRSNISTESRDRHDDRQDSRKTTSKREGSSDDQPISKRQRRIQSPIRNSSEDKSSPKKSTLKKSSPTNAKTPEKPKKPQPTSDRPASQDAKKIEVENKRESIGDAGTSKSVKEMKDEEIEKAVKLQMEMMATMDDNSKPKKDDSNTHPESVEEKAPSVRDVVKEDKEKSKKSSLTIIDMDVHTSWNRPTVPQNPVSHTTPWKVAYANRVEQLRSISSQPLPPAVPPRHPRELERPYPDPREPLHRLRPDERLLGYDDRFRDPRFAPSSERRPDLPHYRQHEDERLYHGRPLPPEYRPRPPSPYANRERIPSPPYRHSASYPVPPRPGSYEDEYLRRRDDRVRPDADIYGRERPMHPYEEMARRERDYPDPYGRPQPPAPRPEEFNIHMGEVDRYHRAHSPPRRMYDDRQYVEEQRHLMPHAGSEHRGIDRYPEQFKSPEEARLLAERRRLEELAERRHQPEAKIELFHIENQASSSQRQGPSHHELSRRPTVEQAKGTRADPVNLSSDEIINPKDYVEPLSDGEEDWQEVVDLLKKPLKKANIPSLLDNKPGLVRPEMDRQMIVPSRAMPPHPTVAHHGYEPNRGNIDYMSERNTRPGYENGATAGPSHRANPTQPSPSDLSERYRRYFY